MKPPFDIAADLDTPVSAYLKLAPFRPRFLLESVEGGERLARYSFLGFGDCLEVRWTLGLSTSAALGRRPRNPGRNFSTCCAALWRGRRSRCRRFPGSPSSGRAGSIHRIRRRALFRTHPRSQSLDATPTPHAHYVAPRSLLVFDHLTRGVALLARRQRSRSASLAARGDSGAARRRALGARALGKFSTSGAFLDRRGARGARETCAGIHSVGRCVPVGTRVALRGPCRTSRRSRSIARCAC